MYLKSQKIKVADVKTINYVKDNEEKVMYILEVGDTVTGITEEIIINKNQVDLLKNIQKGDIVTIQLKNSRGRFILNSIEKEKN